MIVAVVCKRCGTAYTEREWKKLPLVGYQSFPDDETLELRNCECGSTHSVVVSAAEVAPREPSKR